MEDKTSIDQETIAKYIGACENKVSSYIASYAKNKGFSQESANDAMQNARVRALKNKDSYNPELGSFQNWFFKIALNCLMDQMKDDGKTNSMASLDREVEGNPTWSDWLHVRSGLVQTVDEVYGHIEVGEEFNLAKKILTTLPMALKQALWLYEYEGMSYEEMSTHLSVHPQTLRVRVCRAKRLAAKRAKEMLGASLAR